MDFVNVDSDLLTAEVRHEKLQSTRRRAPDNEAAGQLNFLEGGA